MTPSGEGSRILCVGRLLPLKGAGGPSSKRRGSWRARAARSTSASSARRTIAWYLESLRDRARVAGLSAHVVFLGGGERRQPPRRDRRGGCPGAPVARGDRATVRDAGNGRRPSGGGDVGGRDGAARRRGADRSARAAGATGATGARARSAPGRSGPSPTHGGGGTQRSGGALPAGAARRAHAGRVPRSRGPSTRLHWIENP